MAGKSGGGQKGMGFKAAAKAVASKQGIPPAQANAIIAAGARKASPAAKKANPNLKKVGAKKVPAKKASASKSSGGSY
jgi:3-oxoacyl-[acyl-carrier-protein] synthase III